MSTRNGAPNNPLSRNDVRMAGEVGFTLGLIPCQVESADVNGKHIQYYPYLWSEIAICLVRQLVHLKVDPIASLFKAEWEGSVVSLCLVDIAPQYCQLRHGIFVFSPGYRLEEMQSLLLGEDFHVELDPKNILTR
ncbi:hypothetical protein N7528_003984 [Penicillium herquei]|nr:hypothetical protein N7528_003984 [Penicillium herquei]